MGHPRKTSLFSIVFFLLLTMSIFYKFFFQHLYPFPGDFLLAWFEPWKTDSMANGVITIAHKPIASDIFRQFYPFKTLAIDIMKKLQFPLWNPYNGAGMPLLATINIGLLDPFNILFFVFSYPFAWSLYIIFQSFFIGYFTYLYCRKLSLSTPSAFFTSIAFLFSGVVIVRLPYGIFGLAISLLPFLLLITEYYLQNQHTRKIFLFPFGVAILIISTLPQISFYILTFIIIYFLYRSFSTKVPSKTLVNFLIFTALGFGLAAIQLLPTLELYRYANITTASSSFIFKKFLLPPQHLISLFIPNYFGNQATYNYWGKVDYVETVTYLGLIPCFFAFIGLFIKSRSIIYLLRGFLFITVIICILSTIQWIPSKIFFSLPVPILSTGIPSRIFLLSTFCICILAGSGFDAVFQIKNQRLFYILFFIYFCFTIGIFLVASLLYKTHFPCPSIEVKNCRTVAFRNTALEVGMFIVFAIFLFISFFRKKIHVIFQCITIFIITGLGLFNAYKFLPFSSVKTFLPANELLTFLRTETTDARVFGLGEANIKTDFATYFRFYDPNYYHPLYIRKYGDLVNFAKTGKADSPLQRSDVELVNDQNISQDVAQRRDRLAELLSIKYIILKKTGNENPYLQNIIWQDKNWFIVKNNTALPRTYIVKSVIYENHKDKILRILFSPNFHPQTSVILEEKPRVSTLKTDPESKAIITQYRENNLTIQTKNKYPGILVLTDNDYPGWKAFIDGKETKIFRADYTFRAVEIPNGNHQVAFDYEPMSLITGIIISLCAFLFFVLMILSHFSSGQKYPVIKTIDK